MPEPTAKDDLEGLTELEDGSVLVDDVSTDSEETASAFGDNLAETLDEFELNTIATDLLELIEHDKKSRKARDEQQEEGIRRTGLGDDAPGGANFEGASRVVHPALVEGCIDFSARAMKELFPSAGPVKTKINGVTDEKKLDKAHKKRDFLNFYLTKRMPEYRSEKEVLLTQLPLGGSQYEKYWPEKKRIRMAFVPIDKVLLPFAANSFYEASRQTHVRELTEEEIDNYVEDGFFKDVFGLSDKTVEQTASQKATEKVEGKEESGYNEDGLRIVYETSCNWDVEGDGIKPYVIHIDAVSEKICAIYRNWKEGDEECTKLNWWVEDKFLPWRGVYGIGLHHIIGGLCAALTGGLRALLDSAHLNNLATAIKLKGARASGQSVQLDATAVTEIEAPAGVDDIRKIMMPMPFNPPSTVLFQLLDWMTNQTKGVIATAEEKIADAGSNMPVGTALALIEQGSQVFSSIHARLHESQRRALEIICRLLADYPEHALQDMAKFGLTPEDFLGSDDIEPVSDPNIFSETQRFAQTQSLLQLANGDAQDPSIPWNKIALRRRMMETLRIDGIDELLPKPADPVTSDPVSENVAVMNGSLLKANPIQDHQAHIQGHLLFILSPAIAQSPLTDGKSLSILLGHVQSHVYMAYEGLIRQAELALMQDNPDISPDKLAVQAAIHVEQRMAEWMQSVTREIMQASQIIQSKMPKPPVDPAIEATKEVAMAQIEQKKVVDEMEQARRNSAQQFEQDQAAKKQDLETKKAALEPVLEAAKREYEAQLEQERQQREEQQNQFNAAIELMKNKQDNDQHQITELRKNLEDNNTALQMKYMELKHDMEQSLFDKVRALFTSEPNDKTERT